MSSLRNSLHRRNHKERSQLSHRSRLGILEKHKDYVLRARDYHSKQDRITRLRQKAADRNKDEFYFGMTRQKTEGGVHVQERGNEALPTDIVKVLKSQDENYIRTMRTAGLKKIDKLKAQLSTLADLVNQSTNEDEGEGLQEDELEILREAGLITARSSEKPKRRKSARGTPKHIVFAEDEAEAREFASSSKQRLLPNNVHEDVMEEDTVDNGWKVAKSGKKGQKSSHKRTPLENESSEVDRKREALEHRTRLLKELSARLNRDKQLRYAERELEMQKLMMGKGAAKKLQGIEKVEKDDDEDEDEESERRPRKVDENTWKPRVYKWRVERKR